MRCSLAKSAPVKSLNIKEGSTSWVVALLRCNSRPLLIRFGWGRIQHPTSRCILYHRCPTSYKQSWSACLFEDKPLQKIDCSNCWSCQPVGSGKLVQFFPIIPGGWSWGLWCFRGDWWILSRLRGKQRVTFEWSASGPLGSFICWNLKEV